MQLDVGASDGASDGSDVGVSDGDALGPTVGFAVGSSLGVLVGALLGEPVKSKSSSLVKICSELKFCLFGRTSSMCSGSTPNHSATPLCTASQGNSGSSRPVLSSI